MIIYESVKNGDKTLVYARKLTDIINTQKLDLN